MTQKKAKADFNCLVYKKVYTLSMSMIIENKIEQLIQEIEREIDGISKAIEYREDKGLTTGWLVEQRQHRQETLEGVKKLYELWKGK
jgi:hypothetical protein